ncbi:GNAT family N-acetyltransferase [Streptomyces sp. NPDC020096]
MSSIMLKHYSRADIDSIRELLLDIHDEAHATQEDGKDPFRARERFAGFVDHWSSRDGFLCTIAYAGDEPIGYAYGAPSTPGREWWRETDYTPADDRSSTYALSELLLRPKWRKTGAAQQIHAGHLAERSEHLAVLLVDATHPKVRGLYEDWGYAKVGEQKPFEDSPVFDVMVKRLPAG